MTDALHTHLMHAVLDGEASTAQVRELDRILATDPAARARFEALREVFAALERVPEVSPPAGFASQVMDHVRLPQPPPVAVPRRIEWFRRGAAFAAGLLVATAFLELGASHTGSDLDKLAGTMAAGEVRGARTMAQANVLLPDVRGRVGLYREREFVVVTFDLAADTPVDLFVPLPEAGRIVGFAGLDHRGTEATFAPGSFRLHQKGTRRFAVYLEGVSSRLPFEIQRNGQVLHRGALPIPAPG